MSEQSQQLDALAAMLREACGIADHIGLDLAAIRIEEALLVVNDPEARDQRWHDQLGTLATIN
jgi:hypothetical protein